MARSGDRQHVPPARRAEIAELAEAVADLYCPDGPIDPIVVAEAQEIIKELRDRGMGILLTDHNVRETLAITDRAYLIAEGRILISGTADDLINDEEARKIYLGEKFSM